MIRFGGSSLSASAVRNGVGAHQGKLRKRGSRRAQETDLVLYPSVDFGHARFADAHLVSDPALRAAPERTGWVEISSLEVVGMTGARRVAHLFQVEVQPDAGLSPRDLFAEALLELFDVAEEALVLGLEVHEVGALRQFEVLLQGGKVDLGTGRGGGHVSERASERGEGRASLSHFLAIMVLCHARRKGVDKGQPGVWPCARLGVRTL